MSAAKPPKYRRTPWQTARSWWRRLISSWCSFVAAPLLTELYRKGDVTRPFAPSIGRFRTSPPRLSSTFRIFESRLSRHNPEDILVSDKPEGVID